MTQLAYTLTEYRALWQKREEGIAAGYLPEQCRLPHPDTIYPSSDPALPGTQPVSPSGTRVDRETPLVWEIAGELAAKGYIAEITSILHHRAGKGRSAGVATRGIGDVLCYRSTFHLIHPGFKINGEVKTDEGQPTDEQRIALRDGGLVIWRSVEDALKDMQEVDARIAGFLGLPLSVIQNTMGRIGHKEEVVIEKIKRESKRNEARLAKRHGRCSGTRHVR